MRKLQESQAEADEQNQSQRVGTCIVIDYPSASASDSDNLVFTRSYAMELYAESEENGNFLILLTPYSVALMTLIMTLIFDSH